MDKTIAVIKKNAVEEVRVVLSEYRGHDLVSVRIWANYNSADSEKRPTKKGVALRVSSDAISRTTGHAARHGSYRSMARRNHIPHSDYCMAAH